MAKLIALYKKPADAKAFDDHYFSRHVPIAKTVPGLRRYEVNAGPVGGPAGESAYHLVAMLKSFWIRQAAIQQGLASPGKVRVAGRTWAHFAKQAGGGDAGI